MPHLYKLHGFFPGDSEAFQMHVLHSLAFQESARPKLRSYLHRSRLYLSEVLSLLLYLTQHFRLSSVPVPSQSLLVLSLYTVLLFRLLSAQTPLRPALKVLFFSASRRQGLLFLPCFLSFSIIFQFYSTVSALCTG